MQNIYACTKNVAIIPVDGERFVIKASLQDPVHEVYAEVEIRHPSLEILDASAEIRRAPFTEVCNLTTGRMKKLVGLCVGPGFNQKSRDAISGSDGCHRLGDLMAEIATAAYQLHFVQFFGSKPSSPGVEDVPIARRQAALENIPGLRNTCFVYKDGNEELVRDMASPIGGTPKGLREQPG